MDSILNGFIFILLAMLFVGVMTIWEVGLFLVAAVVFFPLIELGPVPFV